MSRADVLVEARRLPILRPSVGVRLPWERLGALFDQVVEIQLPPLPRCPRLQMVRRRTHPLLDVAARAARRRFGGDAALAQFMGEALAPMMKVRLARIEPRSVGTQIGRASCRERVCQYV